MKIRVELQQCRARFGWGMYIICKGVFGTVPVFSVPVWMSYRTYRSVRHRYRCRTGLTKVSVPDLPKCPVPVLMLYRNYQSVRYRYESLYRYRRYRYPCRTKVTEVSGTGVDAIPKLPKCPVPVISAVYTAGMPRYVPYRTHP